MIDRSTENGASSFPSIVSASITFVLCLVVAVACEVQTDPTVLRVGTDVDAENLDPRIMRNTTGYRVANLLYDGLVELDSTLTPTPSLAQSWERPTATRWVFRLRDGVRFHDGSNVTADDVVYTFETILDPALRSPARNLYVPIARVEALDAQTVEFSLSRPYAPFLTYLDVGIVPRHLAESGHDLASEPVGSGPYRMVTWNKGNRIDLEAYDTHWGGAPSVRRVQILVVPDNTARAQAFEAGDLDIIQSPLAPRDVRRLVESGRFASWIRPGIAVTYLNFNTASPLLSDRRLRRAIAHLIDQETIVDGIYEGMDTRALSIFGPTSWAFAPDVRQPTFDPAAGTSVLERLGWRDSDGDGVRERHGERLSLRLGTHSEDVNRVQTIEYLQNAFAGHGIETSVEISDWPSFSARRDAGDYDIILLGWTQLVDPDRVTFEQLHSTGGLNWGRYQNPRLDTLLERGRTMQERETRATVYRDVARIIAEDVPYFIVSHQGYQIFYTRALTGFGATPRGDLRSLTKSSLTR